MAALIVRLLRSEIGLSGAIVAGFIALGAVVWSAVLTYVEFDRRETLVAGIKQNSNLAIAFEEHTARTIKGIDAAAVFLRREYSRKGAAFDVSKYIKEGVIDGQLFTLVTILNERGEVVTTSAPSKSSHNSDRELLQIQAREADDRLLIGNPF